MFSKKINFSVLLLLITLFMCSLVLGKSSRINQLSYSPEVFVNNGDIYTPVDIIKNVVSWKISEDLTKIKAKASLQFITKKKGLPLLLLNNETQANMAGREIKVTKMEQENFLETNYHSLEFVAEPNTIHQVDFEYSFTHDPDKEKTILPVEYYFGRFSERGIPGNGTFDHFPITLEIDVEGERKFELHANGKISKKSSRTHVIEFPEFMTSMGVFVDLVYKSTKITDILTSKIDGRKIPMTVYSDGISEDLQKVMSVDEVVNTFAGILKYKFHEQESFWGSYPFKAITLKISDKGPGTGAFAGAMVLSSDYMEDMSHEISHNYFLQSVVPASGEDTWIFEGLGDWAHLYGWRSGFAKDLNMKDSVVLGTGPFKLWATNEMFPISHLRTPHQTGRNILASFDQYIKQTGKPELKDGLMPVLKEIHSRKKYQTITTSEFIDLIEDITGLKGEIGKLFSFYSKN